MLALCLQVDFTNQPGFRHVFFHQLIVLINVCISNILAPPVYDQNFLFQIVFCVYLSHRCLFVRNGKRRFCSRSRFILCIIRHNTEYIRLTFVRIIKIKCRSRIIIFQFPAVHIYDHMIAANGLIGQRDDPFFLLIREL